MNKQELKLALKELLKEPMNPTFEVKQKERKCLRCNRLVRSNRFWMCEGCREFATEFMQGIDAREFKMRS